MEFFHWLKTQPELVAIPALMVSITMDIKKLKEFEAEGITKTFSKANTNKEKILAALKEILGTPNNSRPIIASHEPGVRG